MYRVTNDITVRKQPQCSPSAATSMRIWRNVFVYISPKRLRRSAVQCIILTSHAVAANLQGSHHICIHSSFTPTTAIVRYVNKCPSKSCARDPWPTTMSKTNIDIIAPVVANITNMSLESAAVPAEMKHALVTPSLKKIGLDANDMITHRPISNLSFVAT